MMSPFVMLNSRSCVIAVPVRASCARVRRRFPRGPFEHRASAPDPGPRTGAPTGDWSRSYDTWRTSGRPLDLAAGRVLRGRSLVPRNDLVDAEQVLGIA